MKLTRDQVVAGLVARGVPEHVAQGVAMNFQHESGFDTGIQEIAPTSGRGGFGLAQWTGPRRIALEDFAKSQGKRIDDPDVQYDFFMRENAGPEKGAWQTVMNAPDAQTAAINFVKNWERPATVNLNRRIAEYQGDSPSEGGARFGGAGLGDPATAAPAPTYSHPLAADAAPTPGAPQSDPWKENASSALDNLGSLAGAGKSTGVTQMPSAIKQSAPGMMAQSMSPVADTSAQDMMRQQLAQRMALLNAGKLFG
jgi:hypothetical protein